ncbi:hypothetical protein FNV43_RR22287 [Rhamnella rubrinervis]|uniref:Uncharacterized protein n=1 Tax=Rhamnella rubrinervis TaxID=2594499 RepID=A0A8K0DQ76_9ROSA|nr:hypothetical protein FNV43_RR22287 [Rhamnella rubrinervis]
MLFVQGMRSAKLQTFIRGGLSHSPRAQLAFLGKVFFSQAKANFADSGISGSFRLKAVESFPNPPYNKEKTVKPLPASLSPSSIDSKKRKAISRVSEIGLSGKLRPQVLYLIELGLDLAQIQGIARRFPVFAYYSLEGKIKPLVEFLLHLGVPKSGIPSILNRRPQLCGISLSENIIPTMAFLESLGVNKKQWAKVIYCSPAFLTFSRQKVKSTVDFLGEMGLSAESIGKILTRFPQIVGYSVEDKLRPTAEYFHSLGVDIAALLHRFPQNLSFSVEANVKPVTEFFLERGFSMEEVGTMISRFAPLYGLSLEKNLIPKWEFFLTMGYPRSELVKHPVYFGYSLEERVKPRYALMKECGVVLSLSRVEQFSHCLGVSKLGFDEYNDRYVGKERVEEEATRVFSWWWSVAEEKMYNRSAIFNLNLPMTQLAFIGKVFFCQGNVAEHGISGSFCLKVDESDNEKPVAPLPATLFPSFLDSNKLKAISRVSKIGANGKLRPQVLYLIELGMDLDQIKSITRRCPTFFYCSLEEKIKPLVEFLVDLGVRKSDIPTIFNRSPRLAGCSLSENLIPTMAFLEGLGVDKKQWAKLICGFPSILCYGRQKVKGNVDFLYEMGLSAASIGKILTRFPQIIGCSVEDKLRPIAEYFRFLGVNVAVLFLKSPSILGCSLETNLKPVTEFFLERGYSMEEVGTMISRSGALYTLSLAKNLIPKWEFFLTMDYPHSDLVKFPAYFGCSLEKRIKPRYALMKECGVVLPLPTLLSSSGDTFEKTLKSRLKKKTSQTCVAQ